MSKSTFEVAMAAAGFNDSNKKISKTGLKSVMTEISDGIWGGANAAKFGLIRILDASTSNPKSINLDGTTTINLPSGITIDTGDRILADYRVSCSSGYRIGGTMYNTRVIEVTRSPSTVLLCFYSVVSNSTGEEINKIGIKVSIAANTGNTKLDLSIHRTSSTQPNALKFEIISMYKLG